MTALLRNRSRSAVFLAYHSVADDGPPYTSVPTDAFEGQLATLARLGFRSGSLADLGGLARGERPDRPLAFLTFDDGYLDNYETARPLLERYGFRGIMFVLPPFLDRGDRLVWDRVEGRAADHPDVMRAMTWEMAEEMAAGGHEFGSHSLSHADLTRLADEELRQELLDSRRRIQERLGRCDALAYPFGLWTRQVATAAEAAGYTYGFTLPYKDQRSADALTIPRLSIDQRDDDRRFRVKLSPAYRAFHLSRGKTVIRRALGRRPAHLAG
jgi:peptidoglycan/xylan/chitin deacetylase (PgdA/CDA1 family)